MIFNQFRFQNLDNILPFLKFNRSNYLNNKRFRFSFFSQCTVNNAKLRGISSEADAKRK